MQITKINPTCRTICKIRGIAPPEIKPDVPWLYGRCTYCGSMTAYQLESYLDNGGDASWDEPISNTEVVLVRLASPLFFQFRHFYDEPLTHKDYERIRGKLEDKAGSLHVFERELNKHFRVL